MSPERQTPVPIEEEMRKSYLDYAMSVIVGRALPDIRDGLKPIWRNNDDALGYHASLIADERRVLVVTVGGELILLDATADVSAIISRVRVFEDDVEVYSHPALVGTRLYIRGGDSVVCIDLSAS